ncbi:MAG: hypothetical protein FWC32_00315 [Firmicutes bacterium]|nr:hypothetical protein [Bacillota bacterium]
MEKLQYDSFYKFLVSIGAIFIAAPIIGIHQLFTGSYDILISQVEYLQLSELSLLSLENRARMLSIVNSVFPWFCLIIFLLGITCVLYGGRKWYLLQKEIDEQTRLETKMKRTNIEKLTTPEVVERIIDEVYEDSEANGPITVDSQKRAILDAMNMEERYFKFVKNQLSHKYTVTQNVRIGKSEYDIVAISKKGNTDLLFEIKHWKSLNPSALLQNTLKRIELDGQNYVNTSNRNFKFSLIIISDKEVLSAVKNSCQKYIEKHNVRLPDFVDISYLSSEDIG